MDLRHGVGLGRLTAAGAALAAVLGLAACSGSPGMNQAANQQSAQARAAASNPNLDTGTALRAMAPDVRLTSQFGQPVSLRAFRGKVVILAFTDSECTTICPLTTSSMVAAKELLGKAGQQVQLLGIDANPEATSQSDVLAYSRTHGLVNQWDFLTGPLPRLRAAWRAFHVDVQIEQGQIDHTPALFVIDPSGRERMLYLTTMAYTTIGQSAELLAQEASSLLPGHPKLASEESLAEIRGASPATAATIPGVSGASIPLAPGRPRLMMFFATWLSETSPLASDLTGLNAYSAAAAGGRLPPLVAVDEAVTEPSAGTAAAYLAHLPARLSYPVGLDATGRVADGYGVQDQPWFTLVSAAGKITWSHDGWLAPAALEAAVRKAS